MVKFSWLWLNIQDCIWLAHWCIFSGLTIWEQTCAHICENTTCITSQAWSFFYAKKLAYDVLIGWCIFVDHWALLSLSARFSWKWANAKHKMGLEWFASSSHVSHLKKWWHFLYLLVIHCIFVGKFFSWQDLFTHNVLTIFQQSNFRSVMIFFKFNTNAAVTWKS